MCRDMSFPIVFHRSVTWLRQRKGQRKGQRQGQGPALLGPLRYVEAVEPTDARPQSPKVRHRWCHGEGSGTLHELKMLKMAKQLWNTEFQRVEFQRCFCSLGMGPFQVFHSAVVGCSWNLMDSGTSENSIFRQRSQKPIAVAGLSQLYWRRFFELKNRQARQRARPKVELEGVSWVEGNTLMFPLNDVNS